MNLFSKSNPFLCVMMEGSGGNFQPVAKTKWVQDNHDPEWPEVLEIEDDCIHTSNKSLKVRIEVDSEHKFDCINQNF